MIRKTAAAGIIIFVLFVSACDYFETGDRLNGIWIAESGARFTFDNTNFTRVPIYGSVETGTYTANDGLIKLSRYGAFVDVTLEYVLQFPYLTIDEIKYTSASSAKPPSPPPIDGFWVLPPLMFETDGFDIVFKNGGYKGDGIEGEYDMRATFKGIYNIRRDLVSNTDKLTMTPTHVHGDYFRVFLSRLPISLFILFDELEMPAFTQEDSGDVWGFFPWWYTPDEVMKYFKDAEARAPTLAIRSELVHARSYFFNYFEPGNYKYSLEFTTVFPEVLNQNQLVTSGARNKLTLINDADDHISILYRYKPGAQPQE
ncbi:MAG: hypothetical protein LBB72_04760 [Spirochaetaceae bacterium]|jgi:hypothetical protein|nr:hypothetical protein [Spirochaetaceae bacterium]